MIVVRLNGGLGNQLFQYATGRALAQRNSTKLLLDSFDLSRKSQKISSRTFELTHFNYDAELIVKPVPKYALRAPNLFWKLSKYKFWNRFFEQHAGFNVEVLNLPDNSYLSGYWQSYKYFEGIDQELMQELAPKRALSVHNQNISESININNSVALHVRRGDYVSLESAIKHHGALTIEYYKAAIDEVYKLIENPIFYVFSDDPAWCASNLPLLTPNVIHISHNLGVDSWQDLILMSLCHHQIIANSSFSWWGGWMADQRYGIDRVVIAPKNWFVVDSNNAADRFPTHWRLI